MRIPRIWLLALATIVIVAAAATGLWIDLSRSVAPAEGPCTIPYPNTTPPWHYWIVYYTNTGKINSVSGGSSYSVEPSNLTSTEAVLNETSNASLVYQLMCSASMNQLNDWHIDLETHTPVESRPAG